MEHVLSGNESDAKTEIDVYKPEEFVDARISELST